MNPQQLLDYIIKPTHEYMGGNYASKSANFLSLCTAAIESNCGEYIKQINGPALGVWQIEPDTHDDIWYNCDALSSYVDEKPSHLVDFMICVSNTGEPSHSNLITSPMYACAMARLKYSMDPHQLPKYTGNPEIDLPVYFDYYKRVYNTELGASTYQKWCNAIAANHILKVKL